MGNPETRKRNLKKGHGHFLLDVKSKYRAMKKLRKEFPIEKMSKVFGVTRSGYYRFLSTNKGKRAQEEESLTQEIEKIFYEHKKRYGSPRMFMELKEKGFSCSEKGVAKIMKKNMLVAKR